MTEARRADRLRVCFVGMQAYGLFDPASGIPHGGMETRAVKFARGLARDPSYEVCFLVDDFGQPHRQSFAGVDVIAYRRALNERLDRFTYDASRAVRWKPGFPGLTVKRLSLRLAWEVPLGLAYRYGTRLAQLRHRGPLARHRALVPWRIYRDIGADVVVAFGVSATSAKAIASAREYGARSVLVLASDDDLSESYRDLTGVLNAYESPVAACRYALLNADHIVVQTTAQSSVLHERFGRDATVIRNPIDLTDEPGDRKEPDTARHVLWIGRAESVHKRPLICIELAERCPEIPFVMVMNPKDAAVEAEVRQRAPANVTVLSSASASEIRALYESAGALVNTSLLEGFPNTFLESGKFGVPVLSLEVDPDGLLTRRGCGMYAAGDVQLMAEQLRQVWQDQDLAATLVRRLREYVRSHHELSGRVAELDRLLRQVRRGA